MIGNYRPRLRAVSAVQWTGANCVEVFAFLEWLHDGHDEGQVVHHIELNGDWAQLGDWIVRVGEHRYEVYADGEFRNEFEPDEPAEYTWGWAVLTDNPDPANRGATLPLRRDGQPAGHLTLEAVDRRILANLLRDEATNPATLGGVLDIQAAVRAGRGRT